MIKLTLLFGAALLPLAVFGQTPEQRGLELAIAADKRDSGFGDFVAEMEMILRNRNGDTSVRLLRIKTLEQAGEGDKSLSIFEQPRDVKGTALLTYSHGLKPDDQWLYLPALKRVKRITAHNQSGPFMGSEFAYEDLGSQEVEKYRYKFLHDEPCGDWECHVIERIPQYQYSGYSRQILWLDADAYRAFKLEFYDRKGALLKTLTASGYRRYLDYYWRPDEMFMQNHQTGKSTRLKWRHYRFRSGLTDSHFNPNALSRVR